MRKNQRLPTLFLDRDGTLVREEGYLKDPDKVKLLSSVPKALRRLRRAGFKLVVVSNQSGVARGLISRAQLEAVQRRFVQLLAKERIVLDGYYGCPHWPGAHCPCRKPRPGLLRRASRELGIAWRGGISVGDRPSDVQLAQNAGGWGVLVLSGYGRRYRRQWPGRQPDYSAANFGAAAAWILSHIRKDGTWTLSQN